MLSGFREPDQSLRVFGAEHPTAIIEIAYSEHRQALEDSLGQWTAPARPARVAIGIDVDYSTQRGVAPRVEVLMQLEGENRPSIIVSCGAGSGCRSPAMFDYTLYVPVDKLLYGAPWRIRMLVSMQLALQVPIYSVVWGGIHAAWDVLYGRRSLFNVASACVRSFFGPWWGVVPLDAFMIRDAAFTGLLACRLVHAA